MSKLTSTTQYTVKKEGRQEKKRKRDEERKRKQKLDYFTYPRGSTSLLLLRRWRLQQWWHPKKTGQQSCYYWCGWMNANVCWWVIDFYSHPVPFSSSFSKDYYIISTQKCNQGIADLIKRTHTSRRSKRFAQGTAMWWCESISIFKISNPDQSTSKAQETGTNIHHLTQHGTVWDDANHTRTPSSSAESDWTV